MSNPFSPGDDLIFQLESVFGLLRVLAVEGEGADQGVAVFGQLPARHLWQQLGDARGAEPVFAALQRQAMGADEGDEIGHGGGGSLGGG